MSGHNSRSRSPSGGVNGRGHSPSFGHQMAPAGMDPQIFNHSPYQAGAPYQNQQQYMSNQYLGDMQNGQQFDGGYTDPFGNKGLGVNVMVDPQLQDGVNPGDIMGSQDQMSPSSGIGPGLGSQHHSPAMGSAQFAHASPGHSRHQSLDPASAGLGRGPGNDWMGHRRSPSEVSDVSSASHSPFPAVNDSFDVEGAHSPMPGSEQSLYDQGIDMRGFTISEAQRRASISAHNSPYISPALMPVAPQNGLNPDGQFVLGSNGISQDFHGGDIGQADTMAAPEINVEFAPPQNTTQMGDGNNNDALSPPQNRGRTVRHRAKSDTSLGFPQVSRPLTAADLSPNPMQQPSLLDAGLNQPQRHRSLSPFDATFPANYRSTSPNRSVRRSSTSSLNTDRSYILELADPNRQSSSGPGTGTRVQKHPATFQCTMCPKRFTRAYNLRSHLRTHTDERPFVCSVCGKAFARQHDRKRHEGLHSGEKKFVCKGDLSNGHGQWGCGRRFARADALGRHFRSEAGRVCIKPLLDEEMAEKRRAYEQSVLSGGQMHMGQMPPAGMPPPAGVLPSQGPGVDLGMPGSGSVPFQFPQQLLAMYPSLGSINFNDAANNGPGMDDDDISGRSSFDAGEDYDDGYVSGPGTMYATGQNGWTSDNGGM